MEAQATETKGTRNLTELTDLVVGFVNVGVKAKADGKIDVKDLPLLAELWPLIGPAFDDVGEVTGEIKDLTPEEATELVKRVAARLQIADAHAILVVEKAFKASVALFDLYKAIKN